jgi:hypothetical protein
MFRRSQTQQDQPRNSQEEIEATARDEGNATSAIITIQHRDHDGDTDSISAMSDPSAFWYNPAVKSHSMLGGAAAIAEVAEGDSIDEDYLPYYGSQKKTTRGGAAASHDYNDIEYQKQQNRIRHQQQHHNRQTPSSRSATPAMKHTQSYSSTPSTGAMSDVRMDETAIDSAFQKAFENQDKDQRKTVAVISTAEFNDTDFWSITEGGKKQNRLTEHGFCRSHWRLICLMLTVALVGAGVAVGLLMTQPSFLNKGQSNSSGSSSTVVNTPAPTSAPAAVSVSGTVSTSAPSTMETSVPTSEEFDAPAASPIASPVGINEDSTMAPTVQPSQSTSSETPSPVSTLEPTASPTSIPTVAATPVPTVSPTTLLTLPPTGSPTTIAPSPIPTFSPSLSQDPSSTPSLQNPDANVIADNEAAP